MLELLFHLKKVLLCFNKNLLMQTTEIADWTNDLRCGSFLQGWVEKVEKGSMVVGGSHRHGTSYLSEALRQ